MAQTMASLCSRLEKQSKDEFRDDGLICQDLSRQDGFQAGEEGAAVTEKSICTVTEGVSCAASENGNSVLRAKLHTLEAPSQAASRTRQHGPRAAVSGDVEDTGSKRLRASGQLELG